MATAAASITAAAIVGAITVGITLPASATAASPSASAGVVNPVDASAQLAGDVSGGGDAGMQAYAAPVPAAPAVSSLQGRSASYSTATLVEMAGTVGILNVSNAVFTNNPNCAVQWPFAVGVPISYGFGPRPGEFHEGVDFTPGNGAHIQAIADGVVRVAQNNYQGYGTAIIIDHIIDGQHWASVYGHMQAGSLQVHVGETVRVGEYIGRTGDTGHSFGAHTHVEIRENGVTPIDPLPWLREHNQC